MKKLLVTLALVAMGVANIEAGIRANNNGQASKMKPVALKNPTTPEAAGETEKILTLEEQHMVVPFNQRHDFAKTGYQREIRAAIANEFKNFINKNEGILVIGDPSHTDAPRLFAYYDETNKPVYIHYNRPRPATLIQDEEKHIFLVKNLFKDLADRYQEFGINTQTTGGRPPMNWIAWYEVAPGSGRMGSNKFYLTIEDVKLTPQQVKDFEEKMKKSTHPTPMSHQ